MSGALPVPAFRRLFPSRNWPRPSGLKLIFWSVLAPFCLAGFLVLAALLIELVSHHGLMHVGQADAARLVPLVAGTRAERPPATIGALPLENTGLLPTVWKLRGTWQGSLLASLWRRVPWLQSNLTALVALLLSATALAIIRLIALSKTRTGAARLALESATGLRRSIHRQAMRLGPSDLEGAEQHKAVQLFQLTADDVREGLTHWLATGVRNALLCVVLLALILLTDWRLGLECLIPFAAVWWIVSYERSRGQAIRTRSESEAAAELRPLAESLRKTRLVRGYAMEDYEHERFTQHLTRYSQDILRGRLGESWSLRWSRILSVLCMTVIAWLLGSHALRTINPISLGGVWLIAASLVALTQGILALQLLPRWKETVAEAGDKIYRYLAEIPEVGQAVGAKFLNPVAKSIILESVTYSRNGQTLLERFDLRIPAGSKTAVVSMDPLAPRAIAYLLPRFLEPQSGRILFDSEDIAWATLESLRAEAIYVGGNDPFFTGSVLENITCGESRFTLQDAMEAAKLTHAHKFISALPNGYETMLGEHGEQLRPGEAFRLGLTRAVVRKPALLIIEEPRDRLDDDSKALIDDAYQRVLAGRTVVFLPSRLSTIRQCDQIVFLQNGKAAAVGPHADLVRNSEVYRHWEYLHYSSLSRQGF